MAKGNAVNGEGRIAIVRSDGGHHNGIQAYYFCNPSCMAVACSPGKIGSNWRSHDNWSWQWEGLGSKSMLRDVFDFGKHRGKHINQVDDGYLKWTINTFSDDDPWWNAAADTLRRKGDMKWQQLAHSVHELLSELKSCTRKRDLQKGRQIHTNAIKTGIDLNMYVEAALINMYAKCGSMEEARAVFDSIQEPDVVSWTAVILGYADNGQGLVALDLFSRMKVRCAPNSVTYIAALKACTSLTADGDETGKKQCLERGREIHSEIGRHMSLFVQTSLVDMYAKCGSMVEARIVFDVIEEPNVVSWNALILGYVENGQALVALNLYSRMKDGCRCAPNSVTYIAALKACASLAAHGDETGKKGFLERGRQIHSVIRIHMNHFVQGTLIDMYSKCGSMEEAKTVFDSIHEPDVVSWNALILGYADNGEGLVALDLFSRMKDECSCAPDSVTYVAALKACGSVGALAIGRRFHSELREFDAHVVTCLVDFYAKCGSMEEAREVFDLHPRERVVLTWTALLAGYSRFGDTSSVFNLFEGMQDEGFRPDAVTFVFMLMCCSHAGLLEKAWEYLVLMPMHYGVTPTIMHYTCMIDLLGRANKLDEAVVLLQEMPCDPDAVTWTTLLGACRKWENVEIGRLAFNSLVDLDKKRASAYILMAEIYGSRGMWEEQERVFQTRIKFGAWKLLGQVWVGEEDCCNIHGG